MNEWNFPELDPNLKSVSNTLLEIILDTSLYHLRIKYSCLWHYVINNLFLIDWCSYLVLPSCLSIVCIGAGQHPCPCCYVSIHVPVSGKWSVQSKWLWGTIRLWRCIWNKFFFPDHQVSPAIQTILFWIALFLADTIVWVCCNTELK